MKYFFSILAGLSFAVALTPRADVVSNGFPKKPITLIVAYSPGGAVDTVARTMAKHIEPYLGQRIVVRNRPGAGGEIGYRSLASANNDGYTIGMITAPPILMLEMIRGSNAMDITNFEVLASIQKDPVVLAVREDSEYRTLQALLDDARSRSSLINVAGDGPLSNNQLQLAVAEKLFGVSFNFVPFNGSGPSISALMGNQVQAAVPSASSITSYVKRGDVRVLAVFAEERYRFLPDAPTVLEETGIDVPDIGAAVRGMVVPNGVPENVRQVLTTAIRQLMQDEKFSLYAEQVELPLRYMGGEEFALYLNDVSDQLRLYMPLLSEPRSDGGQ